MRGRSRAANLQRQSVPESRGPVPPAAGPVPQQTAVPVRRWAVAVGAVLSDHQGTQGGEEQEDGFHGWREGERLGELILSLW